MDGGIAYKSLSKISKDIGTESENQALKLVHFMSPVICSQFDDRGLTQSFNIYIYSVRYNCRESIYLSELHGLYSRYGR